MRLAGGAFGSALDFFDSCESFLVLRFCKKEKKHDKENIKKKINYSEKYGFRNFKKSINPRILSFNIRPSRSERIMLDEKTRVGISSE